MAIADRYIGRPLVVYWIDSNGTITITGDQTSFGWEETANQIEISAGSEQRESYLNGLISGKANLEHYDTGLAGSLLKRALAAGNSGTLRWATHGTAAGKPKYEIAANVDSAKHTNPYADKVMLETGFTLSGDWVKNFDRTGGTDVWP